MLFLEIISDLLEKQETLGLLLCVLTFLFLFLSSFHLCQAQVVWRLLPRSSALQRLLLALSSSAHLPLFSFLLASAASSFNSRDWYRDGSDEVTMET